MGRFRSRRCAPASSTITYKGESFSKNPLDSELGLTTILNAGSAAAPALAVDDATYDPVRAMRTAAEAAGFLELR